MIAEAKAPELIERMPNPEVKSSATGRSSSALHFPRRRKILALRHHSFHLVRTIDGWRSPTPLRRSNSLGQNNDSARWHKVRT